MPCLCKQCRSRSVGFWSALFVIKYVNFYQQPWSSYLISRKSAVWCGIIIYSSWQGLMLGLELLPIFFFASFLLHAHPTKATLSYRFIAPYKAFFFNWKVLIFFLFLHENIFLGYALEALQGGLFNAYLQHVFSLRNKKNIIWIVPLICSYVVRQVFSSHKTI